ncbi:SCO family protein [Peribacillus sp. SCS-37]|uniref:SCO family protein n=1 Tax=Paraperibacillus esterisolvens TaxID=3115296 RepID=UPI003905AAAC
MKKWNKILMACLAIMVLASCSNSGIPGELDYPVGTFKAVSQDGKPFTEKKLKGKIWVADFIFTNCTTVCPPMTANMSKLQQELKKEKLYEDVHLVSFSIDPAADNPGALKTYGSKFQADYRNWSFLTGYSQSFIEKFSADSFHMLVKKPASGDQVIHGTEFALVSQEGKVVKTYKGNADFPLDDMIKHIKILKES